MKALNENAISSSWSRRSPVSAPIESRMISNLPVSTARRYSRIDEKTIQLIGKRPNAAPLSVAATACCGGHADEHERDRHATPSDASAESQAAFRLMPRR